MLAGLDRLKKTELVTEADLRAVNDDDEIPRAIVDLIGVPVNVIKDAVDAVWPGFGNVFR